MNSLIPYIIILVVGILIGSGVVTTAIVREGNSERVVQMLGKTYTVTIKEIK